MLFVADMSQVSAWLVHKDNQNLLLPLYQSYSIHLCGIFIQVYKQVDILNCDLARPSEG